MFLDRFRRKKSKTSPVKRSFLEWYNAHPVPYIDLYFNTIDDGLIDYLNNGYCFGNDTIFHLHCMTYSRWEFYDTFWRDNDQTGNVRFYDPVFYPSHQWTEEMKSLYQQYKDKGKL